MAAAKKILVPTDFSKFSDNALKQAVEMAKQNKAKIYLLHVIGVIQTCAVDYCLDQQTIDALDKKSIESSEDMMRKQIKKVANSKDVEIISYVIKGTPYAGDTKRARGQKNRLNCNSHTRTDRTYKSSSGKRRREGRKTCKVSCVPGERQIRQ